MVLDYFSSDALEEVPTLRNYRKLTWCVLFLQLIVSTCYHFARIHWAGMKYKWRGLEYVTKSCNESDFDNADIDDDVDFSSRNLNHDWEYREDICAWADYECDDYFSHIVNYTDEESVCNNKTKDDDMWEESNCDSYLNDFDSPNYICNNNNISHLWTQVLWTHACNCKNYTDKAYQVEYQKQNYWCSHPVEAISTGMFEIDRRPDISLSWNYCESDAGISFPWVGGIWFVLAVWTTALPQKPSTCSILTLISLLINIGTDVVNFSFYVGVTTIMLILFSFGIVFICLIFMRLAFDKLAIHTKDKKLIDLRTMTLKRIHIIILIGLAQVYISFPAYKQSYEQSLQKEDIDDYTFRYILPVVVGGILNVSYLVTILFNNITKLHFVDFINGNLYVLERIIGSLQFIGFALTFALTLLKLPTKEKLMLEEAHTTATAVHTHDIIEDFPEGSEDVWMVLWVLFFATMVCVAFIWIFMICLAAHVKNDDEGLKYFHKRWIIRKTVLSMEIRKETRNEIMKNHIIMNKDELMALNDYIRYELQTLSNEISKIFSDGIYKEFFNDLIKQIQKEIDKTKIATILPDPTIHELDDVEIVEHLTKQWNNLQNNKIDKPLTTLKSKINEHVNNEKKKIFNWRRKLVAKIIRSLEISTDDWAKLVSDTEKIMKQTFEKIETKTNDTMNEIKTKIEECDNNLRTILSNSNECQVTKETTTVNSQQIENLKKEMDELKKENYQLNEKLKRRLTMDEMVNIIKVLKEENQLDVDIELGLGEEEKEEEKKDK